MDTRSRNGGAGMEDEMNLFKRALLYAMRKWKKTLIVFCMLLFVVSLILTGIAIINAQEEESEELRGTTGASFSVERNLSTGGWANDSYGTYSTQDLLTEKMITEIASVDGIIGYDASNGGVPNLYDEQGNNLNLPDGVSYYAYGSINSQYNSLFVSGRFELVEGSHITQDITNGVILSRESVEQNGLEIGDTIIGVINPEYNDPEVEMKLVGVFDIVADKNDEANMYDAATLYDFNEYAFCSNRVMEELAVNYSDDGIEEAFFYVEDAAKLDSIIKDVQNISSINWDNFKIIANDEVYQNISSSLSNTNTLIITLIIVITVVSVGLLILILSMSIKGRKREIGILLAVGITKPSVLLQYIMETIMMAVVAFPLAYLFSKQIAGKFGEILGKTAESILVTPQYFAMVTVVGIMLLIVAVLISCIPVMRYEPKQILAQME